VDSRVPAGGAEGNPAYGEAVRSSPPSSRGGCPPCA
jgi:hypothetical protein